LSGIPTLREFDARHRTVPQKASGAAVGWLDLIQQCSNPLVRDSGRKRRGPDFFELRIGRWAEGLSRRYTKTVRSALRGNLTVILSFLQSLSYCHAFLF
jgi:hypothetical protein